MDERQDYMELEDFDEEDEDDGSLAGLAVAGAVELEEPELEEEEEQVGLGLGAAPYLFEPRLPEGERLRQPHSQTVHNDERLCSMDW